MADRVFVSYSRGDRRTAEAVVAGLESAGIRCWIDHRDILPGHDWRGSIIQAITSSRAMVLILSQGANASRDVSQEVGIAFDEKIAIIPVRIDDSSPSPSLRYCLAATQWLDMAPEPSRQDIARLATAVRQAIGSDPKAEGGSSPDGQPLSFDFVTDVLTGDLNSLSEVLRNLSTSKAPPIDIQGFRSKLEGIIYLPFFQGRKTEVIRAFLIEIDLWILQQQTELAPVWARLSRLQKNVSLLKSVQFAPGEAEEMAVFAENGIKGLRDHVAAQKAPLASLWNDTQRLVEEYDRDGFWQRVYQFDGRVKEKLFLFVSEGRRSLEVFDELDGIFLQMHDAFRKSTSR